MGRQRDPELEKRLLRASWESVTTQGYAAMSLSQVASDAGAHRTDIYRRWNTKAQLVADALATHLPPVASVDTGSLGGDLRQCVEDLWSSWSSNWVDGLVGLLADFSGDPVAEAAFHAMSKQRAQPLRDAILRAVHRGEITALSDSTLLTDVLEGPIMHRRMIGRQLMTPDELDALTGIALRMLTGSATRA